MNDNITPSSGNVFADLGFPPEEAEALLRQADLDTLWTMLEPRINGLVTQRILTFHDALIERKQIPQAAPAVAMGEVKPQAPKPSLKLVKPE